MKLWWHEEGRAGRLAYHAKELDQRGQKTLNSSKAELEDRPSQF